MENWYSYPSNFSNNSGVNGLSDFILYTSTGLGEILGITNVTTIGNAIMVLIFIISFGLFLNSGISTSLIVSGFVGTIFSYLLLQAGLLNAVVPIIFIVLLIIGAVYKILTGE